MHATVYSPIRSSKYNRRLGLKIFDSFPKLKIPVIPIAGIFVASDMLKIPLFTSENT